MVTVVVVVVVVVVIVVVFDNIKCLFCCNRNRVRFGNHTLV